MLCSGGAHIPQWFLGKVSWDVDFFDTAPLNMSVPSSSSSSRCRTPSWKLFSSGKLEGIALSPSGFQYRCEEKEAVLILYFFSVWNLGEPSLSSQGNDISRWCVLAWVYFCLLCWALCESLESRKLIFGSVNFSWIILLMIPLYFFIFFLEFLVFENGTPRHIFTFSLIFSSIFLICHSGKAKPYLPIFPF